MKLTVVLPLFNEEALLPALPGVLQRIRDALKGHEVRLLAIDDGSTDSTAAGLAGLAAGGALEVETHAANRGVGAAMTTGLSCATGEAALVYDPDEAYEPGALRALVDALAAVDLATLSPYHPDGGVERVGFLRLLMSRTANRLYRARLRRPFHTFTCAVRAYRLPQCRALLPAPDDFTAAAALMAAAIGAGLRIAEVPAVLRARRAGSSKMRLLTTIRAHLKLLRDLSVTARSPNRPRLEGRDDSRHG